MNFIISDKKYYFLVFALLYLFLSQMVLAQNFDEPKKDQQPIAVKVLAQNGNPLRITITNTDNSDSLFQMINYAVQNTDNKAVLAYTLIVKTKSSGKTSTMNFNGRLFQPNSFYNEDFGIERPNIKPNDEAAFSIDYVLFEDGSSWGANTEKESERIIANLEGRRIAAENIKYLLDNQKTDSVINIIKEEITSVSVPDVDTKQTEKWQAGFRQGYKSVIWQIKLAYDKQGIQAVATELEKIKGFVKIWRK